MFMIILLLLLKCSISIIYTFNFTNFILLKLDSITLKKEWKQNKS